MSRFTLTTLIFLAVTLVALSHCPEAYAGASRKAEQGGSKSPPATADTASSGEETLNEEPPVAETKRSKATRKLQGNANRTTGPSVFYVDPVNGSMTGDGSAERPWSTFQAVAKANLFSGDNPNAGKIHAGDTVYLLSGNHGNSSFQGKYNTDFITVAALPGHTPIVSKLFLKNTSKWKIIGITFQNPEGIKADYLVSVRSVDDFVFMGNTIQSRPDISNWTSENWLTLGSNGIILEGNGGVVSHNLVKNVRRGIVVGGDNMLIADNVVEYYADDGIDFASGNTVIKNNYVLDHYGKLADGNHNDGMQGWALDGIPRYNLVIEGNYVIESTGKYSNIPIRPSGIVPDTIQGISIFDGRWINVLVANNVVACSAYHGLSFYGLSDSMIINNTLARQSAHPDLKIGPWLGVFPEKGNIPPSNVVVRNNLANSFALTAIGVSQDHNISFMPNKSWTAATAPTSISGVDPSIVFADYDLDAGLLDLTLAIDGPAINSGSPDGAPLVDIRGRKRKLNGIDIGAFAK